MRVCKGSKRSHWGSWATRRTSRSDLSCHTLILWIPDKAAVWMKIRQNFRMVLKRLNCKPWLSKLAVILGVIFTVELARASRIWTWAACFSALTVSWSSFWMLPRCYGSLPSAWIFSQSLGSCLSFLLRGSGSCLLAVFFSVAAAFQQKAEISLELVVFFLMCVFFSVRWKWNVFDFVLVFLQISPGHKNRAELSWIIKTWSLTWSVLRWRGCDCSRLLLSKFMSYTPTIKYTIVVVFWQNETIHCMSLCSCLDLVQH